MQRSAAIAPRRALRSRARVRRALGGRQQGPAASTHAKESLLRPRGHVGDVRHLRRAQDLRQRYVRGLSLQPVQTCRGATRAARRFSMQHPPHAARAAFRRAHEGRAESQHPLPRGRRVPLSAAYGTGRSAPSHRDPSRGGAHTGTQRYPCDELAGEPPAPALFVFCRLARSGQRPACTQRAMRHSDILARNHPGLIGVEACAGRGDRSRATHARLRAGRRADAGARALLEAPLTRHLRELDGSVQYAAVALFRQAHTMSQRRMLR